MHQRKKNLNIVDHELTIDFDLLIGAGCVAKIRAGILGFEVFGLVPNFRKKSEAGEIITKEGVYETIIAGFRAVAIGLSSLPWVKDVEDRDGEFHLQHRYRHNGGF